MINFVSSEKEKKLGDIVAVKTETQTTTWKYMLNHKIDRRCQRNHVYHPLSKLICLTPVYLDLCDLDKTTHKLINSDSTWAHKS